jgi:hypothetical protein
VTLAGNSNVPPRDQLIPQETANVLEALGVSHATIPRNSIFMASTSQPARSTRLRLTHQSARRKEGNGSAIDRRGKMRSPGRPARADRAVEPARSDRHASTRYYRNSHAPCSPRADHDEAHRRPSVEDRRARARPARQPRPARDARDVPLRTSLYFELGPPAGREGRRGGPRLGGRDLATGGRRRPSSCSGRAVGSRRAPRDGCGRSRTSREPGRSPSTSSPAGRSARDAIHRDGARVGGRGGSDGATGSALPAVAGTWSFTTEAAPGASPGLRRSTWAPSRSAGTAGSSRASATSSSARRRRTTGRRTT